MNFDEEIAARTLWMEFRGEGATAIKAGAHVLLNRKLSGKWGASYLSVCLWALQFSSWNASDPNRMQMARCRDDDPVLQQCRAAIQAAPGEPDPTHGSTHYYSDIVDPPFWALHARFELQVGKTRFYSGVDDVRSFAQVRGPRRAQDGNARMSPLRPQSE